jgi:hypothetical protein
MKLFRTTVAFIIFTVIPAKSAHLTITQENTLPVVALGKGKNSQNAVMREDSNNLYPSYLLGQGPFKPIKIAVSGTPTRVRPPPVLKRPP